MRNEMGGQTWVNLASGGHTLPEETGALRLASTLIAFTYSHTNALTHTHACIHAAASSTELLYHRDAELVRTSSDSHILFIHPFLYITILFSSPCFLHNPIYGLSPTPPHCRCTPPYHFRILFVCPLLLYAGTIHPKG